MDTLHLTQRLDEFIATSSCPLIVLLGPTASGKTALSIQLAHELKNVEIINADSRHLYQYLNIGTAKIMPVEMQSIPHHLLDVLDPKQEATAAWYKKQAGRVIGEIHSRKNIPILVGGSMLYISAVIDDLAFPVDPQERQTLQQRKNLAPRDDLFIIGIERPRKELMQRINARTHELFARGWVEEVRALLKRGYASGDPAMKSHGYREIIRYLQTGVPSLEKLEEVISSKTRHYAKRQMTWWKNDSRITWITPD